MRSGWRTLATRASSAICGFASSIRRMARCLNLSAISARLFMDEAFRGRGLMKPMLEAAYEWFRDAGITVVTLSVLHRNWVGATAWHRLGFSDWREERRMDLKPRQK